MSRSTSIVAHESDLSVRGCVQCWALPEVLNLPVQPDQIGVVTLSVALGDQFLVLGEDEFGQRQGEVFASVLLRLRFQGP